MTQLKQEYEVKLSGDTTVPQVEVSNLLESMDFIGRFCELMADGEECLMAGGVPQDISTFLLALFVMTACHNACETASASMAARGVKVEETLVEELVH